MLIKGRRIKDEGRREREDKLGKKIERGEEIRKKDGKKGRRKKGEENRS